VNTSNPAYDVCVVFIFFISGKCELYIDAQSAEGGCPRVWGVSVGTATDEMARESRLTRGPLFQIYCNEWCCNDTEDTRRETQQAALMKEHHLVEAVALSAGA
jgi:hypothetical protein